MNKHLAAYFREERLRQGITLHALARTVAPDNARKTAGRIGLFEAEGIIREELLAAVADALGIELPVVEEIMELDRREVLARGDPPRPAGHRTASPSWKIKLANPTPPPSKTPA